MVPRRSAAFLRRRTAPAARRPPAPLRRALLWTGGVVLAILVVLGGLGALRVASVARDLERAAELLRSASAHIEQGELAPARDELGEARDLLTRANGRLYHHPAIELAGALPILDENLAAARDTVALALRMTDGGGRLLDITRPLEAPDGSLEVPLRGGSLPLDAVRRTKLVAEELAAVLPGPNYEPASGDLIADPIERAQAIVYEEAGRRRDQLDAVGRGLSLLTSLAGDGEPHRYLIAVANTAEMRGAGGMILSYGILESVDGTFSLGEFGGIDDLLLDEPVDPAEIGLPPDYVRRWEGLDPTGLWRNVTVHPDFAFDAGIMQSMFAVETFLPLDGVIQIDPAGLAAILAGTGPVAVEGLGQVDATNVVDLTLNRAYLDFPDRDQRQEVLGDVAEAAFDALVSGEFGSLRPLGEALHEAAERRHIVVHLNDGTANSDAASFGATGELPAPDDADHLIVTVQNFSRNKLDYYLDTAVELTGSRPGGAPGALRAVVTVTNTAPADGGASYVFGPNGPDEVAGLYRGLVSLYVPAGASLTGSSGDAASAPVLTTDAGRAVVGFDVEVPAGETRTVTVELAMAPRPAGDHHLTLVPVPRVRPTLIAVDVDTGSGRLRRASAPVERLETLTVRGR